LDGKLSRSVVVDVLNDGEGEGEGEEEEEEEDGKGQDERRMKES